MNKVILSLTLFIGSLFATPVNFQVVSPPPTSAYGYSVGFATALVDNIYTSVICNDFYSQTYIPSAVMTYTKNSIGSPNVKFHYFMAQTRYEVAAILLEELKNSPSLSSDYQFALWNLFSPSAPLYGQAANVLMQAMTKYYNGYRANGELVIYTPTNAYYGNQEFLAFNSTNIPEPSTLLGAGVILLLIGKYKRSNS